MIADDEKNGHGGQDRASLANVAYRAAEEENRGGRDDEQRPDLQDVGPDVRVLERMGGIGVEEAAAVGAELLDDFLARHRPDGDRLLRPFERGRIDRAGKRLRNAEGEQDEGADERDRQQDVERHAGHIDPEIADRRGGRAGESAHQRERHREAGRRRQEVVHGEAEHLGEIAHRGLAAVVLPVRVGDEAARGVEGELGRHGVEAARIQRQKVLQPLQGVERQEAHDRKGDHRHRVGEPVLLTLRIDAGQAVEPPLDRRENGAQNVALALEDARQKAAQRDRRDHDEHKHERDLRPAGQRHRDVPGSEFFGMDEGVEQVQAEADGHDQPDNWFGHGPGLLKSAAAQRRRAPSGPGYQLLEGRMPSQSWKPPFEAFKLGDARAKSR